LISCAVTLALRLENNSVVSTVVAGSLYAMDEEVINNLLDNNSTVTHTIDSKISKAILKKDTRSLNGYSLYFASNSFICESENLRSNAVYRLSIDSSSKYQVISVEEFIHARPVENFTELVNVVSTETQFTVYESNTYILKHQSSTQQAILYMHGKKIDILFCNPTK